MTKGPDNTLTTENTVIFGFGAQGRAQALNLRDRGVPVSVFIRPGSPRLPEAEAEGIPVITDPADAASRAQRAIVLIPDSEQPDFYREHLHGALPSGSALVFAHGFSVHYGGIAPRPDLDVLLAAPLGHANAVREGFASGGGVPFVIAVHQDVTGRAWERVRDYARAVGGDARLIESTFAEEVETDLFAEQAVLCGGMPELVRTAFDTLVEAGYNPDIAYFCCLRELQPIVEIMARESIAGMRERISDTARFGSMTRGPKIIGDGVRKRLEQALSDIRTGEFAREFAQDRERGFERLKEATLKGASHQIEELHRKNARGNTKR